MGADSTSAAGDVRRRLQLTQARALSKPITPPGQQIVLRRVLALAVGITPKVGAILK
jgi:hypothetical protein